MAIKEYVLCDKADLVNIADSIRGKTGSSELMLFPSGLLESVSELKGANDSVSLLNRKVQCGTFVPSTTTSSFTISHNFGSIPSGCMYWVVSDVIDNTDAASYTLGCYISDFYGRYGEQITWGRSVVAYESNASSTSNTPTSQARIKTLSGGSIGAPWSGTSMSNVAMHAADNYGTVKLGGTGANFVAGMEYQYILFGGLEE